MNFRFITFHFNPEHLWPVSVRELLIILKVVIFLFQHGVLCSSGHPDELVLFVSAALEPACASPDCSTDIRAKVVVAEINTETFHFLKVSQVFCWSLSHYRELINLWAVNESHAFSV